MTLSKILPCAIVGLATLVLAGCRDEPQKEASSSSLPADAKRDSRRSTPAKRISPEAMKLFRLEVCYLGALGLRGTRDAYLASLGGATPGPDKIPAFGAPLSEEKGPEPAASAATAQPTTPAPKSTAAPTAKPTVTPDGGAAARDKGKGPLGHDDVDARRGPPLFRMRLPYTRHIRSCTIAKKLKQPAADELDPVTDKFETYVMGLHKSLHEAYQYYARKQYDEDKFERGQKLHTELTESFGKLDAELDAFAKAYDGWRSKLGAPPDKLDAGGELASKAMAKARALVLSLWAKGEIDAAALEKSIEEVTKAADELDAYKAKEEANAHATVVGPALRRFVEKLAPALAEVKAGKLSIEMLFDVTYLYVAVVEANHQALARMLNPSMGRHRPDGASRLRRPDVKGIHPPQPIRRPEPAPGAPPVVE